jgi:hypothetical protein
VDLVVAIAVAAEIAVDLPRCCRCCKQKRVVAAVVIAETVDIVAAMLQLVRSTDERPTKRSVVGKVVGRWNYLTPFVVVECCCSALNHRCFEAKSSFWWNELAFDDGWSCFYFDSEADLSPWFTILMLNKEILKTKLFGFCCSLGEAFDTLWLVYFSFVSTSAF